MLTIHHLAPIMNLASTLEGLRDASGVTAVLTETGWDPSPPDHDGAIEDCRWTFTDPSNDTEFGAHTWTSSSEGTGLGLGIIVEAPSLTAAGALRDAIRDHVAGMGSFVPVESVESDETWCSWSDGRVRVDVGVLAGSEKDGTSIPPIVEVGLEPEDVDSA